MPQLEDCKASELVELKRDELFDEVKAQGIKVTDAASNDEVELTTAQEAYFALLTADMQGLADKYKRDVEDIHKIFFQVSCDREKLHKILEDYSAVLWNPLEDLAVMKAPDSEEYKLIVERKGGDECLKRRIFLQC